MAKFKLNIKAINAELNDRVEWAINESLDMLKIEIDKNTPEDTKNLLWNTEITKAIHVNNRMAGKIFNDTEYWLYVEYWLWRSFRYNKPKWSIFYIGNGARMFTRAFDKLENKILNLIKLSLK